jgi:hypothetical protein
MALIKVPLEIVSIRGDGYHCFTDMIINGKIRARMIVDTGASRTVFDYNLIMGTNLAGKLKASKDKATGLGTNTMKGHTLVIKKLEIGDLVIKNYIAGILDLQFVNKSYEMLDMPTIQGAIGSDLLFLFKAGISYSKRVMTLSPNPVKI